MIPLPLNSDTVCLPNNRRLAVKIEVEPTECQKNAKFFANYQTRRQTFSLFRFVLLFISDHSLLIPGHVALTKIKCIPIMIHHAMYPARDTLQHVIEAWCKVA